MTTRRGRRASLRPAKKGCTAHRASIARTVKTAVGSTSSSTDEPENILPDQTRRMQVQLARRLNAIPLYGRDPTEQPNPQAGEKTGAGRHRLVR